MLTLMVFVWLGAVVPNKFKQVLSDCEKRAEYKCLVLQQIHFIIYFEKYKTQLGLTEQRISLLTTNQKEDLLKLLYLYDRGGIYSDLDNKIDYDCLNNLKSKQSDFFFGYAQTPSKMIPNNNFIYTPAPKSPQLKRIINSIKNCPLCTGQQFAGKLMLLREKASFSSTQTCIRKIVFSIDGQQEQFTFTIKNFIKSEQFLIISIMILVVLIGIFILKKILVKPKANSGNMRRESFQAIQ